MSEQKSTSRDNFSVQTKRVLAGRVAYRCSFPNCAIITIGPDSTHADKVLILGEAAHIHAAAGGGPRYNRRMSPENRRSAENGIWMCRGHARLIDADHLNYTAETLLQWKNAMEKEAHRAMRDLEKDAVRLPTTLICLSLDLIFEGVWKSVEGDTWSFIVKDFVLGDEKLLKSLSTEGLERHFQYIIVESQGDGRLIHNSFRWELNQHGEYEIRIEVSTAFIRRTPDNIGGDFAVGPDGDLIIENGNLSLVSGKAYAMRLISDNLSIPIGSYPGSPFLGSKFLEYYNKYKGDPALLNRLTKVELIRLITIPNPHGSTHKQPELNFVNRIFEVRVLSEQDGVIKIFSSLQWGDGSLWEGIVDVSTQSKKEFDWISNHAIAVDPLHRLRELTAGLPSEEIREKVSPFFISRVFTEVLPRIEEMARHVLETEIFPLFMTSALYKTINESDFCYLTSVDLQARLLRDTVQSVGLLVRLTGFKRAGLDTFELAKGLFIYFDEYAYQIGDSRSNIWLKKLYHKDITENELSSIVQTWINVIIDEINRKIVEMPYNR